MSVKHNNNNILTICPKKIGFAIEEIFILNSYSYSTQKLGFSNILMVSQSVTRQCWLDTSYGQIATIFEYPQKLTLKIEQD